MAKQTLYWYDYESFGANPMTDRLTQFAGIRTDEELNIIGEPLMIYCKPANDFLPSPEASMVTGITPQEALSKGLPETKFIARINNEFSQPNTCVVGYNNIRFDDEFTRYTLYRNLFDPYAREWQNGCSRWDLIDVVRLTRGLRPEGINWPINAEGRPSARLEDLTVANNLNHESAHDALSDVYATIAVAKLIKQAQPKLYDFAFQNRGKHQVAGMLNLNNPKPVVHISGMYPSEQGNCAVVLPLAKHPTNPNGVVVYDLSINPEPLLTLTAEEINNRIFTPRDQLPEGVDRIPLKTIHINKCPIVAPIATLDKETAQRLNIDLNLCRQHMEQIQTAAPVNDKIGTALSQREFEEKSDPDYTLYGGAFFSNGDRQTMNRIHTLPPAELAGQTFVFEDARLPEMLFRFRARNYPETLSEDEQVQWEEFRLGRLEESAEQFFESLAICREQYHDQPEKLAVLDQLETYADMILP